MEKVTSLPDAGTQVHARETDHRSGASRGIAITLWVIGLLTLAVASVVTHNHPGPWPFELAFSRTVQHLSYWSWVPPLFDFFGTFNNPTPTGVVLGIVFTAILLLGWYRQAIFLALTVGIGNGVDALIGDYVVRPRPSPGLVHVDVSLKYNSFPSGHCCHVILFYGFLLCSIFFWSVFHGCTRANTGSAISWLAISPVRSGWCCSSSCINGQRICYREGRQRKRRPTLWRSTEPDARKPA